MSTLFLSVGRVVSTDDACLESLSLSWHNRIFILSSTKLKCCILNHLFQWEVGVPLILTGDAKQMMGYLSFELKKGTLLSVPAVEVTHAGTIGIQAKITWMQLPRLFLSPTLLIYVEKTSCWMAGKYPREIKQQIIIISKYQYHSSILWTHERDYIHTFAQLTLSEEEDSDACKRIRRKICSALLRQVQFAAMAIESNNNSITDEEKEHE